MNRCHGLRVGFMGSEKPNPKRGKLVLSESERFLFKFLFGVIGILSGLILGCARYNYRQMKVLTSNEGSRL